MSRDRAPGGGGPPDDPLLDLPLGDRGEEEPAFPPPPAAVAASAPPRPRRPGLWVLVLVGLAAVAVLAGYFLRRAPARLTASSTLADFGTVRIAEDAAADPLSLEVTLANEGGRRLAVRTVALAGEAAEEFALVGDDCSGRRVRPGEQCSVRVAFSPRQDGPRQAALEVFGDSEGIALVVPLLGVGASGRLAALPAEVSFGARPLDESGAAEAVTVDNRGSAAVEISELRVEGAAASDFTARGCRGRTLAPGETCEVAVEFVPRAEGDRRASLRVVSDAAGRPPLVWLTGVGEQPLAELELSPPALDLGAALVGGEGTSSAVTVRNGGDAPAVITAAAVVDGSLGFRIAADGCSGGELAAGASCEITVGWSPTAAGPAETEVRLALAEGGDGASLPLSGRGEGASLTAEPERLDFGTRQLGAGRESFLTLANPGRVAVPLAAIELEGSSDFVLGGDCRPGARLAPASTCAVTVRFSPRSPGDRSARLMVRAAGVSLAVPLAGRGAQPPRPRAAVTPERLSFGAQAVGERGPIREVRVANRGDARLPLTGFSVEGAHAGEFRLVAGSCQGATYIAPAAECTVGVRFVPAAAGARTAELVIRHGGPGGRSRVRLAGTGS